MKNKKRNLSLILIISLLLTFSLTGCNENQNDNTGNNTVIEQNDTSNLSNNADSQEVDSTQDSEDVPSANVITRDMVADEYKWALEKVYADTDAFMSDIDNVKSSLLEFDALEGNFTSSYENFLEVLSLYESARRTTEKLYVFSTLQSHTDTANTDFSDLVELASQLNTDLSESTSFIWPMVVNLDEATLASYMSIPKSNEYEIFINDIIKQKEHILDAGEEEILAQAEVLFEIPESIYDSYNYLTDLSEYLPEPDWDKFWSGTRNDKKDVLETYYLKSSAGINLLSEIYESEIKKNTFFAEARRYDSALESALNTDGVTTKEYGNFFSVTHDNLDKLHKWVSIKKEILGIDDKMHIYDQYTPLIDDSYSSVDYESGNQIIYEALAPLGEKYITDLENGFNSRWVDVYATEGKYENGYQWGTYDTDPFILLNFYGRITDVSTIAHEMGHALNFKYTNEAQDYFASEIPIFCAEIASTTNESLVFEYQISNATNKLEKQRALLNYINLIENTIFTQMIYADFEKRAYEAYEAEEPLNADLFNQLMADVLNEYYGEDYMVDDIAKYQWSEIPHFYNAFYVYKYATGLSAGLVFSDNILNGSQADIDKYLSYLASGSSEAPLTLLRKAGVDFSTGEPLQRAYDRFEELVDEFYDTLD